MAVTRTRSSLRLGAAALLAGTALLGAAGMASAHGADNRNNGNGTTAQSARTDRAQHAGDSSHDGRGDRNAGDIWLDNVGQPAGPGHEQDPHLGCANITLWGAGLADAGGTYTIDGWPPSGSKRQDYASTWSYSTATGGAQAISVIDVRTLIASAVANGDAPKNRNGFHFKLTLVQDPQKHKTFWVYCPAAGPSPAATGSQASNGAGSGPGAPGSTPVALGVTQAGAVQGSSTGAVPAPAQPAASGADVAGVATAVPMTGTAIALAAVIALLAGGVALVLIARRRVARAV